MPAPRLPDAFEMRAMISALSAVEKKLLGGMILLMIKNHTRVRDREWLAENFTRLAVPALSLDSDGAVDRDIDAVKALVRESLDPVLNAALPLFARVAADMAAGPKAQGFCYDDCCEQAMSYFGADPGHP